MKYIFLSLLLIPALAFGQASRDAQKKAARQTANVATLTADLTLTYLDAETQLLTPSGTDRTVTLPSTNVWKAWTVTIVNEDATNKLVIKSSDGTTLDTLAAVGQIKFVARQATPTGLAHWTNLSKIGTLGVTDGSSACVGCVGETVSLSSTTVTTLSTSVWFANPTPMGTIPAGSWMVFGECADGHDATITGRYVMFSTNTTANNTGGLGGYYGVMDNSATTVAASQNIPVSFVSFTSSTPIYLKVVTYGAAGITSCSGRAIRYR